jgi:hypothetical protein
MFTSFSSPPYQRGAGGLLLRKLPEGGLRSKPLSEANRAFCTPKMEILSGTQYIKIVDGLHFLYEVRGDAKI